MDLKELAGCEGDIERHWYYASKARALDRLLQSVRFTTIADIGAGSGFFAKHLLEHRKDALEATCIDVNYGGDRDEWVAGKRVSYRKGEQAAAADLYLLMDVVEHVERDVEFVQSVAEAAPRSAHFLITVPAFEWLWSGHDVYLGHHRRYSLGQITEVARQAGLIVDKRCYFFGAIFPAVAAVRIARNVLPGAGLKPSSDMRRYSTLSNRVLDVVCRLEEKIFPMNRAFGLTAFVLARRNG